MLLGFAFGPEKDIEAAQYDYVNIFVSSKHE